jgi:RNA polymerase sigma factor (sigma-70 family)
MSEWSPDVTRLAAWDDDEWLAVERAYCGRLYAYVARRIGDAQAREDIVQEAFLGAVRGIERFDPLYTFEQYLFGICKNRMIDHLRKNRMPTLSAEEGEAHPLDALARDEETPSGIVRVSDLAEVGDGLLVRVLRDWVQETWAQDEFVRLMVIEALFSGGWRNRDTWRRFELRDETSVAGIKFRALKRLRELAALRDPDGTLLASLSDAVSDGAERLPLDVQTSWRRGRVSCPARHWLARHAAGTLEPGPAAFVTFHLGEMGCEWCAANVDDLERAREAALEPFLERMGASTVRLLRSRNRS